MTNILSIIQILAEAGADNFLVLNLPDFGDLPEFSGTPEGAALSQLSSAYNAALATQLDLLAATLDINLIQFLIDQAFKELLSNPAAFGLTNTTEACVENLANGLCNPDEWLFWDGGHEILASQIARIFVAEPGTLVLLGLGLILLAWVVRRSANWRGLDPERVGYGCRSVHLRIFSAARPGAVCPPGREQSGGRSRMEHRWGARRAVDEPVRLTAGGRLVVLGRMQDVSHSGAFILTCARIRPLMLVEIELGRASPGGGRGGGRIPAFVVRNAADGVGVEWCEYAPVGIQGLFALSEGRLPSRSAASSGDC